MAKPPKRQFDLITLRSPWKANFTLPPCEAPKRLSAPTTLQIPRNVSRTQTTGYSCYDWPAFFGCRAPVELRNSPVGGGSGGVSSAQTRSYAQSGPKLDPETPRTRRGRALFSQIVIVWEERRGKVHFVALLGVMSFHEGEGG